MIKPNGYQKIETPAKKYYLSVIDYFDGSGQRLLHKKCRTATESLIYGRVVAARYQVLFGTTKNE